MYLGHETSDKNNVHPLDDLADEHELPRIPQVRYPPQAAIERYFPMSKPEQQVPDDAVATSIFVGQVPNMLPLPYLAWAIDCIAGRYVVECVRHARKSGCAIAYVRKGECDGLYERSRKVLFDVIGFWAPTTAEQETRLTDYTAMLRNGAFPKVHKDGRIPKSCMVFEELGRPRQATQGAPELGHLQLRDRRHKNGATNTNHQRHGGDEHQQHPYAMRNDSRNGRGGHRQHQQQQQPYGGRGGYGGSFGGGSHSQQHHSPYAGGMYAGGGGSGGGSMMYGGSDAMMGTPSSSWDGGPSDGAYSSYSYGGGGGSGAPQSWSEAGGGAAAAPPSVFGTQQQRQQPTRSGGTPLLPLGGTAMGPHDSGADEALRQSLSFVTALVHD